MPSLADVANDIKGLLNDIKSNTATIIANTAHTASNVSILNTTCQAGFTNIANGIAVELALQNQTNVLLNTNNEQNETIICWLKNMANVLCDIKHNTDDSVAIERDIDSVLTHIDKIVELVHAPQAMEVLKLKELENKIGKCCPPEPRPVVPCFQACPSPEVKPYRPVDIKWVPIKFDSKLQ